MTQSRFTFIYMLLFQLAKNSRANRNYSIDDYYSPVFPTVFPILPNHEVGSYDKHIPRHIWIAVRNISDGRPSHLLEFARRNSNWTTHYCDNDEKDAFMDRVYQNTSLLWAYNIVNPLIGTAKSELWRLAVLYAYGGMYMDDDANIQTKLDDIVGPDDKFIIGEEPYDFDDRCYFDSYSLSNFSMSKKYGVIESNRTLFNDKFFFNWAFFSSPQHILIRKSLEFTVDLIKREYDGNSAIKMYTPDRRCKLLQCMSTYTITHVARELVLQNTAGIGLVVRGTNFNEYGGEMKAWYNDFHPKHWIRLMTKKGTPYLREYTLKSPSVFNNQLIQAAGGQEIYLVQNSTKFPFSGMSAFIKMGFDTDQVRILPIEVLALIPQGPPI